MDTAIGIDLGGTDLRAALVDDKGRVLTHVRTATDAAGGPDKVLAQMVALISELDLNGATPRGIGVGSPGPLNAETGVVSGPPTLQGWHDYPLRARLAESLKMTVALDNDGHAAALGEWVFGAARGLRHFAYVTVSTGIGGGIVADGRMLRGRGGLAGHVGHMVISDEKIACSCGNVGCWEALASGTALGLAARKRLAERPSSRIPLFAASDPVTARHVGQAARDGDDLALELVAREAAYLGVGITNLLHLYAPERVIIGGGLAALFDMMAPDIRAIINTRALPAFRDTDVVPAALGGHVGIIGAAALILSPAHSDR